MSNAENLKRSEIYMLRDMQRHENLHPGVPYAPGGPGWSAIWDLEKRGLVQQFKPEGHRSGYCLTPDGHIVVEDLPAIPQDSVGSFSAEESKMLRVLQAHGKTQPGVPYHADGQELGVIRDLRKKGLVMYSEPSHPHERYGYVLSGAGMVAVDALTEIQHPPEQQERPRTCSDERPCVNCFADNGECLGAYPKEAQGAQAVDERAAFCKWFEGYSLTVRMNGGTMNDAQMFDAWEARAAQPAAFDGKTVADRLDRMADAQPSGSPAQSDLYAAATVWRKHLASPAASPQPAAWRYRYATDERDARAWSFTDDAGLIERLGEEFEIQPLTVQN